jgi:hypothetical protein
MFLLDKNFNNPWSQSNFHGDIARILTGIRWRSRSTSLQITPEAQQPGCQLPRQRQSNKNHRCNGHSSDYQGRNHAIQDIHVLFDGFLSLSQCV